MHTIIRVNLKVHKNSQATKMNLHQWQLIAIIAIYEGGSSRVAAAAQAFFMVTALEIIKEGRLLVGWSSDEK